MLPKAETSKRGESSCTQNSVAGHSVDTTGHFVCPGERAQARLSSWSTAQFGWLRPPFLSMVCPHALC